MTYDPTDDLRRHENDGQKFEAKHVVHVPSRRMTEGEFTRLLRNKQHFMSEASRAR